MCIQFQYCSGRFHVLSSPFLLTCGWPESNSSLYLSISFLKPSHSHLSLLTILFLLFIWLLVFCLCRRHINFSNLVQNKWVYHQIEVRNSGVSFFLYELPTMLCLTWYIESFRQRNGILLVYLMVERYFLLPYSKSCVRYNTEPTPLQLTRWKSLLKQHRVGWILYKWFWFYFAKRFLNLKSMKCLI